MGPHQYTWTKTKNYYLNCYKKYVYKVEGYIFSGIDFLISKDHCFHEPFFYTNIIELHRILKMHIINTFVSYYDSSDVWALLFCINWKRFSVFKDGKMWKKNASLNWLDEAIRNGIYTQ